MPSNAQPCELGNTNFEFSNIGVEACKSYSQCKNHQRSLKEQNKIVGFFKKKDKASSRVVDMQIKHDQYSNQDQQSSFSSTDLQTTIH